MPSEMSTGLRQCLDYYRCFNEQCRLDVSLSIFSKVNTIIIYYCDYFMIIDIMPTYCITTNFYHVLT